MPNSHVRILLQKLDIRKQLLSHGSSHRRIPTTWTSAVLATIQSDLQNSKYFVHLVLWLSSISDQTATLQRKTHSLQHSCHFDYSRRSLFSANHSFCLKQTSFLRCKLQSGGIKQSITCHSFWSVNRKAPPEHVNHHPLREGKIR